jgi:hypothetical protein
MSERPSDVWDDAEVRRTSIAEADGGTDRIERLCLVQSLPRFESTAGAKGLKKKPERIKDDWDDEDEDEDNDLAATYSSKPVDEQTGPATGPSIDR